MLRMGVRVAIVVGVVTLAVVCKAEPARYFRQHGGVSVSESPLPVDFGSEANLVWRREVGPGHSTPCIVGDRILLTTFENDELATIALDRRSGRLLWRQPAPSEDIEPYHPTGSPASCTPAADGERLFVFFGSYGLLCYDLDGALQWARPMGPFQDEFGAASSPVLVDGRLFLAQDHDTDSFLICIDADTGETLWKTPRPGFTRSYSTPVLWEVGERRQIVVAGALVLTGYDFETGERLWWVRGLSRIVDSTPVVTGDRLIVATWTPGGDLTERISMQPFSEALTAYDKNGDGQIAKGELPEGPVLIRFFRMDLDQNGALDRIEWEKYAQVFDLAQNVAISVRAGGGGDITDTHVEWMHRRGLPTVPSPLVYEGVLYMVRDGGIITALDAASGEMLQQGRSGASSSYYASPVAGDGMVYLASESGVMTVLEAGRKWSRIATHDFRERTMATPVIDRGRIYIRTEAALYCYRQHR